MHVSHIDAKPSLRRTCLIYDDHLTHALSVVISRITLFLVLASVASGYYLSNESQNLGNHAADAVGR